MLRRILSGLLKGRRIRVPGTRQLSDGTSRTVTLGDIGADGTQVLLCRVEGRLHALDTLCPHQRGRLESGPLIDGKYARCPVHNYLFAPKSGSVVSGTCRKATTYRVRETGDDCELLV